MAIDWRRRRPLLGNVLGGLSGPAIKPIALRAVYQVARAVERRLIGIGGIATVDDVMEFPVAGAIGRANRHGQLLRSDSFNARSSMPCPPRSRNCRPRALPNRRHIAGRPDRQALKCPKENHRLDEISPPITHDDRTDRNIPQSFAFSPAFSPRSLPLG